MEMQVRTLPIKFELHYHRIIILSLSRFSFGQKLVGGQVFFLIRQVFVDGMDWVLVGAVRGKDIG